MLVWAALVLCAMANVDGHCTQKHGHNTAATSVPTTLANMEGPVTKTPAGMIRGSWMETRRGRRFQAYRGIKYAEPPTGPLRFQPPKPIFQYEHEVDATQDGPSCPRPASPGYFVAEDCLTVNVYTPGNNSSKPLPVIFFIHPGGFYTMSGRCDLAGPHYLLDRDLVLVTINYRLGSLGFLSTGDKLAPGNNGMKDQVVALRWVQRNIAAFGGDPNSVTIAGTSAGSKSVILHMISPMAKGLFHRGIAMSGSPTSLADTPTHQRHLAVKQAQLLGCPTNNSKDILDCLMIKSAKELGDSLKGFFEFGYDPVTLWKPVVEPDFGQERYLTIDPIVAIREGKMHAVPLIISRTTEEFSWFAYNVLKNETLLKAVNTEWERIAPISFLLSRDDPALAAKTQRLRREFLGDRPLQNDADSAKWLGRIYANSIVGFPVHRLANLMCRHSPQPVYYYQFDYVGARSHYEDPITKKPLGAVHHDDLIYVFTLSYRFPAITLDSPDSQLVDKMTAMWYNFARYGDPNPRGDTPELASLKWPAMTPTDRKFLLVDKELSIHSNMFEDDMKLWEEMFPIQY